MHRFVAAISLVVLTAALAAPGCGGAAVPARDTGATTSVSPGGTPAQDVPEATPTTAAAPSGALIFRASGNYVGEVYRVDVDGRNLVNLSATGNPAIAGTPSPDGSHIALTRNQRVVVMNPDGSDATDLGPGTFVSWSPDGTRILYGNFGESYGEWWIMNRDGTGARLVVPRCAQCASPQWLLDGQSLVAEIGGAAYDAAPSLFIIDPDGTRLRSLPGAPGQSSELSLSPDGGQILFVERSGSRRDNINVMWLDGAGLRTVWSGSTYYGLAWSPDSARIAFAAKVVLNPGDPSPPPVDAQLVVLDLATGVSHVVDGGATIYGIAWSPDSRALAYALSRDPVYRIRRVLVYTIPAAGGTPTRLSDGPWQDAAPKWSDDGKTITFSSDRSSKNGVYAFDAESGQTTLLQRLSSASLDPDEHPSPAAVGGCLAPPAYPGEGYVIGCLSPDGRLRTAVTDGRVVLSDVTDGRVYATSAQDVVAQNSPPAWSPDGTRVAFFGGASRQTLYEESWLYLLDLASGQATRLVAGGAFGTSQPSILWSHDGAAIYYTRGGYCTGGCTPGYLYRVAIDGSGEEKLTDLRVATLYGFAP